MLLPISHIQHCSRSQCHVVVIFHVQPSRVNWANSDRKVIRTMAIPIQNKNPVRIASFSNSLTTISYSFIIWLSDCDQATPHILVITILYDKFHSSHSSLQSRSHRLKPVLQCSHTHSPYCLILQPNLPQCLSCCLTCFGWS